MATEQPRRSSERFSELRQEQPLHTRWSGASETAQRKSRTSAHSTTRRTSSGQRRAMSLRPHPNPSNPCRTHNTTTRSLLQLRSQYTATLMLSRIILLHRRHRVVSMLHGKSRLPLQTLSRIIRLHRRHVVLLLHDRLRLHLPATILRRISLGPSRQHHCRSNMRRRPL
jgi:hypothetical protein